MRGPSNSKDPDCKAIQPWNSVLDGAKKRKENKSLQQALKKPLTEYIFKI